MRVRARARPALVHPRLARSHSSPIHKYTLPLCIAPPPHPHLPYPTHQHPDWYKDMLKEHNVSMHYVTIKETTSSKAFA